MLEYTRFHPEHLQYIQPYALYRVDAAALAGPDYRDTMTGTMALTAWSGPTPIAAAGLLVFPGWETRALGWAVFAPASRPHMLEIARKVKRVLDHVPIRRIEIQVRRDFKLGRHFATLTGFQLECDCKRAFFPDGSDAAEYVRIR